MLELYKSGQIKLNMLTNWNKYQKSIKRNNKSTLRSLN